MAVFFTSDTHFGHAGARGLYRRPFGSTAEMDAAMLDRWNATVGAEDEVWHLGDFALGMPTAATSPFPVPRATPATSSSSPS